jgi:hypothetical protein
MLEPDPLTAPVIPPVIVPTVHVNELGTDAVKLILVLTPVHALAVFALVIVGIGFIVIVPVALTLPHPPVSGME